MDDARPTAIAWSLTKAPYLSAGNRVMRARLVRIMVVENYLVTSFGVMGRKPRITVTRYPLDVDARKYALRETRNREREGFELQVGPVAKKAKPDALDILAELVGADNHQPVMDTNLDHILCHGVPLDEAASPAVSPV